MSGRSGRLLLFSAVATLVAGATSSAFAGAVETLGQDARYLGAGGISVADDPVAVFHNPAGVANIHGTKLQLDALYMDAEVNYTPPGGKKQTADPDVFQPGVFIASDAVKPVGLGFGIYSPFARDIHFDADPAAGFPQLDGKNVRIDFAPVIALRVNEKLSIGGGPIYARLDVTEISPLDPATGFPERKAETDGGGWGGALGAHYKATDKLSFGAVWKSRVLVETEGRSQVRTPGPDSVVLSDADIELDWKYPQQAGLGASYKVLDALRVNLDVIWTEWSYWNEVPVDIQGVPVDPPAYAIDGEDAWKYGLGVEYDTTKSTTLRAGYQYDQRGIPEDHVAPHKPDAEGNIVFLGVGHDVNANLSIDVAYFATFLAEDEDLNNVQGYPGTYDINAQGLIVSAIAGF